MGKNIQLPIVMGVVKKEGKILLARRHEPSLKIIHDKWEFPGGKIEFGEDPKVACEREILEETGVIVKPTSMLPFPYTIVRNYKKKRVQAIIVCFFCEYKETLKDFQPPSKISETIWADINKMDPVQIQTGTLHFIYYLLQNKDLIGNKSLQKQHMHYISLQSIDKTKNRLRQYDINIESSIQKDRLFKTQCLWGRLVYDSMQAEEKSFKNRDDMLKYIDKKLISRLQHGYKIINKSNDFPYVPALDNLEYTKKYETYKDKQLKMFK